MDFTKFASILSRRALFFCRLDCLGDDWEGTISSRQLQRIQKDDRAWSEKMRGILQARLDLSRESGDGEETQSASWDLERFEKNPLTWEELFRRQKATWTAANCWHENEVESAA